MSIEGSAKNEASSSLSCKQPKVHFSPKEMTKSESTVESEKVSRNLIKNVPKISTPKRKRNEVSTSLYDEVFQKNYC